MLLKKYRTQEYVLQSSGWTLLKSAEEIFKLGKSRIFNSKDEFQPEPPSKWRVISEILKVEIPSDIKERLADPKSNLKKDHQTKILILCNDSRTCYQLNQFLVNGEERCLFFNALRSEIQVTKLSEKYKNVSSGRGVKDSVEIEGFDINKGKFDKAQGGSSRSQPAKSSEKQAPLLVSMMKGKKRPAESKELEEDLFKDEETVEMSELDKDLQSNKEEMETDCFRNSYILTMTQKIDGNETISAADFDVTKTDEFEFQSFMDFDDLDITNIVSTFEKPLVFIQTFRNSKNKASTLDHTLMEMKPDYIILYNINVTAIRQIEIFEARAKRPQDMRLRVYVLLQSKN